MDGNSGIGLHRTVSAGLIILLLAIFCFLGGIFVFHSEKPQQPPTDRAEYLAVEGPAKPLAFDPKQIPSWLLVHVGVIAALQTLSVLTAAQRSRRPHLSRQDARIIQFLCEIPMYLGLFGTLLGVCLTQFITGSLVAPLAYLTTMSGIFLHVLGKLAVWLPLSIDIESE